MSELELKPEQQAIVKQAEVIYGELSTFKISNQEEYDKAGEHRKSIKGTYKQIEELRFSFTTPLDELKKKWIAFFNIPLNKLSNADSILEKGRLTYSREQERLRQEAEEKLRKAAEAEEVRKRKIKEEQERAWREKEEAARKEADRLAQKAREATNAKAKAEAEAAAAKARVEAEKAAKLAEERKQEAEDVQVIAPILAPTITKTAGIGAKRYWKFEIVDESLIPRKYLIPDAVKIGKEVRAAGDTLSISGIRIFPDDKESVRS